MAGLAAEFGVVILLYLRNALEDRIRRGDVIDAAAVVSAIGESALLRLRPKTMTVAVILAGLLPIPFTGGGREVMRRIAASLFGA